MRFSDSAESSIPLEIKRLIEYGELKGRYTLNDLYDVFYFLDTAMYITPLMTLEGKLFSDEQNSDNYIGHITAEEVDPESVGEAVEPLWEDYWESKEITKPIFAEDIVVFKLKDTLC